MVSLFAGKPPGIPYAEAPVVHAVIALSMEYFWVPGGMFADGSLGDW
jgi:hypothetical protein